jgi:hypothetical protein
MRRTLLAAGVAGVAILAGLLVWLRPSAAKPEQGETTPVSAKGGTQLPIGQVILYSSGVGYFQREGAVEGNTRIDLSFPVTDINDLLKSMVLRDLNGGHVSAVSYESQAPVEKTLKSFAINFTNNPSFSAVLGQAKGERVEAVLQQSNATQPGTITGAIMGVEKQKQQVGKDATVEVELLNLWCAEGIRSAKLADVQRIRFLNPVLESEVKKALETLALSHDTQKKAVSLSFNGEGKRDVRVGYVIENPIWKTSYRLVLSKEDKPYLQGWAVVDNPSDEDWNGVRMALVSGRPISFQMNLYTPLYVPRPVVEPELFASLRPPTFEGIMPQPDVAVAGADFDKAPDAKKPHAANGPQADSFSRQLRGGLGGEAEGKGGGLGLRKEMEQVNLRQGARDMATASQLGDFFQYVIDNPVSLARQRSAMLPIVNKDVEGARVSIYNQGIHPKFPMLGLKFKNTSGLHLMQGPITVFEGSSYAGDARILDLQPNEERLLAYAVDLGTEVEPVVDNPKNVLRKVKVSRGIVYSTTRLIENKTYKVTNRSDTDRTLLIEHPNRPEFTLTSKDKPKETARDVLRFELKVPAGKSASETVTEERDVQTQVILSNSDSSQIQFALQSTVVSDAVKKALGKAMELKGKRDLTAQDLNLAQQQLGDIERDQDRLRKNLKETPPQSEAYKKYLAKLDAQEGDIDKLTARIKELRTTHLQQSKDYDAFLISLDLE